MQRTRQGKSGALLLLFAALAYLPGADALDPGLRWYTLEGAHFKLSYHAGEEQLAQHALDVAEQVASTLDPWLEWQPKDKVYVVLTDHVDLPNGLTTSFPRDHIELYVSPPDGLDSLEDFDDWFRLLITHEYTHILQLDKATGAPGFMQHFFGRNLFLLPGTFQPTALLEGLAVYDETDQTLRSGRGQSSLYAMYMRAEVQRGVRPWSQVTMAGVTQWPEGTIPYLYGINFYQFIADTYGRGKIPQLVDEYSDHLIPFRVGSNLEDVLGDDRDTVWEKFTAYLQKHYAAPPYPAGTALVEGERLTAHGYDTADPRAAADGRVFYVRDDSHQQPAVMVWQAGKGSRELAKTFTPARLDWNLKAGLLMARPEVCHEYHLNFDLYRVDPDDGGVTRLTHCGRYHYASWSPDGTRIAAARIDLGQSSLVLMSADGSGPETLWSGEDGVILGELDWSPDGSRLVAALWRPGRRWGLEEFSFATKSWEPLAAGVGDVGDPQYTPDGKAVLFSADAGGVYNLRRVDLVTHAVTTLTHVASGAFSPSEGAGGDIYYLGYTPDGYDVYRLPAAAVQSEPIAMAAAAYASAPMPPKASGMIHDYSPWDGFLPAYWSPELGAGPGVVILGAQTSGQDALGVHLYAGDVNYEFTHHLLGGSLLYQYADRLQFLATREHELYSTNTELQRIRRQDRLQALYQLPWVSLQRTLTFSLGAASDAEKDVYDAPGFTAPPARDAAAGIAIDWNSTQAWPLSISPNDGRDVTLVAESSDVFPSDFHGNAVHLDWHEYIRAGDEAVVALRYLQGHGIPGIQPFNLGGATDPGIGTPAAQILFDRRRFAFPGYPSGLAQLTGDNMRLASVGVRIPIMRPESGLNIPPVGVHDFSLRVYYDAGGAWDQGGRPARYSRSFGTEWVSDLSLFYLLDLRVVVGAAHGFDAGGENQAYLYLETPLF